MAITSMRGYGGQNAMLMRTESISDSLVAMLGSCSSSPHHLSPPELIGQKRPFSYTSNYADAPTAEEAEDGEDGGDDCSQQVEKKRRLTFDQVRSLERNFEIENKLEPERKMQLAKELGLQPRQVAVWFQNRRARWKTKQLERDYEILTSDYNKLKADLDLALRETNSLKAELQRVSGNSNSEDSQGSLQSVGATELSSGTTNQTSCPGQIEESRKAADPTVSSRPTNHRDRTVNPTIDVTSSTQKKELKDSETTTSSGSNSSDVLDADSPRTSESLSPTSNISPVLSTCFQFSAEPIFPVGPSLLPVNEDLYHRSSSCAVKAEDGMADFHVDDAACNYFLPNLVDDQSALPWWEWP